jgi:hypothetical protein
MWVYLEPTLWLITVVRRINHSTDDTAKDPLLNKAASFDPGFLIKVCVVMVVPLFYDIVCILKLLLPTKFQIVPPGL